MKINGALSYMFRMPVCLSACKQGTVENKVLSNKEEKKIRSKNIHFDKTGPAASFDWDAKSGSNTEHLIMILHI